MAKYPEFSEIFPYQPIDNTLQSLPDAFVGRETEMKTLHTFLKDARNSSGHFVIISGEAGTGKTSLVNRFASEAIETGINFFSESFSQAHFYEPYRPFWQIVERLYNAQLIDSYKGQLELHRNEDHQSSQEGISNLESLFTLQSDNQLVQQQLMTSILQAARESLILITFRDVHLAPSTAWQFIHYLSESIIEHKILLLLTLRQDGREVQSAKIPVYAEVLQRMNREGLVDRIHLKRFEEEEIRLFLRHSFQRTDFSNRFIPVLTEISGGLPTQVIACLEMMYREGIIYHQNDVWFNREDFSKEVLLSLFKHQQTPAGLLEQFKQLSPERQILLQYASLMSETIEHVLLSKILEKPRHKVLKDLIFLKEAKFLIDIDDQCYLFKYPAISVHLQEQIPADRRSVMHMAIAEAVEQATHINCEERIYRLAYHYRHSENKKSAFQYLVQAGDLAIEHFAFAEAKEFYEQAFELIDLLPEEGNQKRRFYLLLKIGWLCRVLADRETSLKYYQEALELCKQDDNKTNKLQILVQKGLNHFQLNDWNRAISCFEQVLSESQGKDLLLKAMAHYGLGNVYLELAKYEKASENYSTALTLARQIDNKTLQANIINNLGILESVNGNRMRAIAIYRKVIPIYKEVGDNLGLARTYTNLGITHADEKNWEQANEYYGQSLRVSDAMGLLPLKALTFLNRALALAHLKRIDEAIEYNVKAYRILKRLRDDLGLAEYHKIQAAIERMQGNWSKVEIHLDEALEKFKNTGNQLGIAETQHERALLAKAMNDQKTMVDWLKKALQSFEKLGLSERVSQIEDELEKYTGTLVTQPS